MEKYDIDEVLNCYNETAQAYSDMFCNELDGKPFDREVLKRFSQTVDTSKPVVEFAAGSGHISRYLYDCGVRNIVATDITKKSLEIASRKYPELRFEERNMLKTGYPDGSIEGIVCFYGIVHFTYDEIDRAIAEWKRILRRNGRALFCFHVGNDESLRIEKFLDNENAKATWNFFDVDRIVEIMNGNGIRYEEVVVRYPYLDKEHPTKRCYIQFVKR